MKRLAALLGSPVLVLAVACAGEEAGMEETDQVPMEEMEPSSEMMMEAADSVAADSVMADTMMEEGMPEAMMEEGASGGV